MTRNPTEQQFITDALTLLTPVMTRLDIHADPATLTFTGPGGQTATGDVTFNVGSHDGEMTLVFGEVWLAERTVYAGDFPDGQGFGPLDINLSALRIVLDRRDPEELLGLSITRTYVRLGDRVFPARPTTSGSNDRSVRLGGRWLPVQGMYGVNLSTLNELLNTDDTWTGANIGGHLALRNDTEVVLHGHTYTPEHVRSLVAFLS